MREDVESAQHHDRIGPGPPGSLAAPFQPIIHEPYASSSPVFSSRSTRSR